MTDSQNNPIGKHTAQPNDQEKANFYEDEINLIDFFKVIWKRKIFILLGSVLPTLIVGLIFYFVPKNYKVTYVYDVKGQSGYDVKDKSIYEVEERSVYDTQNRTISNVSSWNFNQNNYKIFLERFYSSENTNKIKTKLQEYNPEMVTFEVWPSYKDLSIAKITNTAELENIRKLEAQLLKMAIVARSKNYISKISLVIRDNFEKIMPLYAAKDLLVAATRKLRDQIGDIEENKTNLELSLKTNKAILAKLKKIKTKTLDKGESNIVLQIDISGKTEYLPVEYQIQAVESKIIEFEELIEANREKYSYYKILLVLNEKLLAELKDKTNSSYTIQEFLAFLATLADSSKDNTFTNVLKAFARKIENRISISKPVTEKPNIYPVGLGTAKKSGIAFVTALIISVFATFLLEGLKKSRPQAS